MSHKNLVRKVQFLRDVHTLVGIAQANRRRKRSIAFRVIATFVSISAIDEEDGDAVTGGEQIVGERFERHRQPWTHEELEKLKLLARKGMALKAISKAMTRSEESIKDRAKLDGIGIAKLR